MQRDNKRPATLEAKMVPSRKAHAVIDASITGSSSESSRIPARHKIGHEIPAQESGYQINQNGYA
jgi:hypothetical protein